jgi:hypothetical protein
MDRSKLLDGLFYILGQKKVFCAKNVQKSYGCKFSVEKMPEFC